MSNETDWKSLAKDGKIEEALWMYIRDYDHVSWVELQREFGAYIKVAGDREARYSTDDNLVVWEGLSNELLEPVMSLLASRKIFGHTTSYMTYFIDGAVPRGLPIAKKIPAGGYKKPHWLPIVFRVIEDSKAKCVRSKLSFHMAAA